MGKIFRNSVILKGRYLPQNFLPFGLNPVYAIWSLLRLATLPSFSSLTYCRPISWLELSLILKMCFCSVFIIKAVSHFSSITRSFDRAASRSTSNRLILVTYY
ncbi:Uncharacterized protein APZ42_033685 [Daphnia magna]|uniref:Uncharacterized protein n=1 Tax=Daphnia magna TaxID=35525 RepID=A0A164KSC2_9CRUS|nr:Uncharacterized protein APZ42_033685 [Daphnia magna]